MSAARALWSHPDSRLLRSLLERHTRSNTLFASAIDVQRRSLRRVMTSGGYRTVEVTTEAGAGVHVIGPDRSELHCARSRAHDRRLLAHGVEADAELEVALGEVLAELTRGNEPRLSSRMEVVTEQCRQQIVNISGCSVDRESHAVRLHVRVRVQRQARDFVARRSLHLRGAREGAEGTTADAASSARRLVQEARDIAIEFIDARPVPRGITDVVLANGTSGIFLHEVVGHCLEGDVLLTGQSVFSRMLGERIATASWTVVDEPLVHGPGPTTFDDEGERTKAIVLVEQGRLRASLLDRRTALRFGLASSHNGRLSSFRDPPLPRMSHTMLLGGDRTPDEIVRRVKRGVYIERLRAAGVVIGTGEFTFVVSEARLIENGRLTAPLSELTVVGNGPRQLMGTTDVGTDPTTTAGVWECVKGGQSVDVAFGGPTLRLHDVVVRGSA